MADYATIEDVRAEGLIEADADDTRVALLLTRATAFINEVTGQFFEARAFTMTLDGPGDARQLYTPRWNRTTQPEFQRGSVLHLPVPAIDITEVRRVFPGSTAADVVLAATDYRVYNRTFPTDDRRNPKLVHLHGSFERGHQAYELDGTFGFVENPSATITPNVTNTTPLGIQNATVMLVAFWSLGAGDPDSSYHRRQGDLTSVRVQGRSASWGGGSSGGGGANSAGSWSGNHEIDRILMRFRRPMNARTL